MKKKVIAFSALCATLCVFAACHAVGSQEDTSPSAPVQSLKDAASYTVQTTAPEETPTTTAESTTVADTTTASPVVIDVPTPDTTATTTATPETTAAESRTDTTRTDTTQTAPETTTAAPETSAPETTTAALTTEETTAAPAVEKMLDFDVLRRVNNDIYAWLEIGGTIIDDPVLQSVVDDTRYLNVGYDGKESTAGALFTESAYNGRKFNDPVTVIYGHRTIKGHMFGALQATYSDADSFASHSDIKIYLPNEVRHYTVFAAVPYDNTHILYTYDFSKPYWYNNFFNSIKQIRAIGANFNEDAFPESGDRVIILSVCLEGDDSRRYLVMAALSDDLADNTVTPE